MSTPPVPSRQDLVAMVARAHLGATYEACKLAGAALAAQSKLPRLIAENLGAGFGQWTFFPDASEVVAFACAYVPPQTAEDVWTIARAWASDDAATRHSILALVGRDILIWELRRVDVPALRELFEAPRASRAREMRKELGLDVAYARAPNRSAASEPEVAAVAPPPKPKRGATRAATIAGAATANALPAQMRMPKPTFKPRPVLAPEAPSKRFEHAKFGVGVLERADGTGPEAKLTVRFSTGSKTLLARFLTEVPDSP